MSQSTLRQRLLSPDVIALCVLLLLWLLFFWRLFTPTQSDQASLTNGDFSGQFVAFAGYQYQRFATGEVPLWNPYNNGGFPFIADTQAAVFYPPRLATIALSILAGGWNYHALELEMTLHILIYSLFMYAFVRRLTKGQTGSILGALVATVIASYGGFMTSYPPLQLALLEAAIWLPLATLGILEATRHHHIRWQWLALTGFALGLSWMAGHPQTSWFLTYFLVIYFGYRVYVQKYRWTVFVIGTALFGLLTVGITAVQLFPGLEYLLRTARVGLDFDAKSNGLLFQDISQFVFPGVLGPWWPLYVGIPGLILALIALWRRLPESLFWGSVAFISLLISMGSHSALFHALYNLLPGMRFFRGQERAVYLVANSLAVLAGMGMVHLATWDKEKDVSTIRNIRWLLLLFTLGCGMFAGAEFIPKIGTAEIYTETVSRIVFSVIIAGLAWLVIPWVMTNPKGRLPVGLLVTLVIFDLFTVNIDNSNYDPVPPQQQLEITPPPLIADVLRDGNLPFRVDGRRGLHDNFGSLYGVADIRGISPLFLSSTHAIIEAAEINPLAWELFAVRYVYSDWNELPVSSDIIATGEDRFGAINLHRLTDPRPFAHLVYAAAVVDSDEFARALLADPNFNPRQTVIVDSEPAYSLSGATPDDARVIIDQYAPEQFTLSVDTSADALLSIANPDYPGWQATLDGEPTAILRAYGALSAINIPTGSHTVQFTYLPLSYRIGAILSLFTWATLGILTTGWFIRNRRYDVHK